MNIFLFIAIVHLYVCSHQADESCGKPTNSSAEHEVLYSKWVEYVKVYKEYYEDLDECNEQRRKLFEERMKKIEMWNKDYEQGLHNFTLGQTIFTARSMDERKSMFTLSPSTQGLVRSQELTFRSSLPEKLDWRGKGIVPEVKYQRSCAACYAFSVVDALAAQYALKTGELVPLSAQMIIDCTKEKGNSGCKGGLMTESFKYIMKQKGIAIDSEYPFIKEDGECRENLARKEFSMKKYIILPEGDEEILKKTLYTIGPLAIGLDADLETFEDFRGDGIYDDPRCKSRNVTHSGLLVGYGTEGGVDYWLVKNNWSKLWGDKGYIKIRRNNNNRCGIASFAAYPVI